MCGWLPCNPVCLRESEKDARDSQCPLYCVALSCLTRPAKLRSATDTLPRACTAGTRLQDEPNQTHPAARPAPSAHCTAVAAPAAAKTQTGPTALQA
jgi:hypothetical protein